MAPLLPHTLLLWRRLSQAGCLLLFGFLFVKTDYTGSDQLQYAVNIIFRLDPLLAASVILATRAFVAMLLPALAIVALSLVLGRSFCGWLCPMGTLLDLFHKILPPLKRDPATLYPQLRFLVLIVVLGSAFFSFPLAGYVDPFSLLVRGLALVVHPAMYSWADAFFTWTYHQAPESINLVTEPLYSLLRQTVLPFDQKYYELVFLSALLLSAVFLADLWQRRFFCRNICPLGAMLGLLAKVGFLRLQGGGAGCGKCRQCRTICRMGAIDQDRRIAMQECSLCMECLVKCPRSVISFSRAGQVDGTPLSLSRRSFIGAAAAGVVLPALGPGRSLAKFPDPLLIRPPGALAEKEFVNRCVRCGECMKVCIGNGLQPVFLEAGLEGIFTPKLMSRLGYCEFNCTLCGQVCPTGALRELSMADKHLAKIGHAFFDKNLCLPYAKGIPCIVCEEHCPTSQKAISFREARVETAHGVVWVKQPFLRDELCIGCGICQYKCPLPGRAGVRVTSTGEARDPENTLPGFPAPGSASPYG